MEHSFDIEIATEYGIECAILLKNIFYWVEKNRANGKHFHDGEYWTYNSVKAFSELFPYITEKKIRTALKNLEKNGFLKTGNYNKSAYDRTTWYSVTEEGKCLLLKRNNHLPSGKMEDTKKENEFAPEGEPIPDIKPYINTNNTHSQSERIEELEENFSKIYAIYPRKLGRTKAFANYQKWLSGRKVNGRTVRLTNRQMYIAVYHYVEQCKREETRIEYYKHFDTLMGVQLLDYLSKEELEDKR